MEWLIIIFIYFVPTIRAYIKRNKHAEAIMILNLFLGWTFVGWVVALVWACMAEKPEVKEEKHYDEEEAERIAAELWNKNV